jgi:hypothetical protein
MYPNKRRGAAELSDVFREDLPARSGASGCLLGLNDGFNIPFRQVIDRSCLIGATAGISSSSLTSVTCKYPTSSLDLQDLEVS